MKRKLKAIDLFAGCGGLCDGFEQSQKYKTLAAVEWETAPTLILRERLKTKWGMKDADKKVLLFDMQRTEELVGGWHEDPKYGDGIGLDKLIPKEIDVIIGGPPCQAYSIAGRVRDEHGMRNDYRNYLFESYLAVVKRYKPKAFVFENVPGILSAKPGDGSFRIIDKIKESFDAAGYEVLSNLENAKIDMTEYGVPQNRQRIIILGISREHYGSESVEMVNRFYSTVLPSYKTKSKLTVRDAISDLPKLIPLNKEIKIDGKKYSHSLSKPPIDGHNPRYHSKRDIKIFKLLASDAMGKREYISTESLKELYTRETGKKSSVHKYHVCEWDQPSNLIPAHLYKDGLRHIHPDPKQARTLTVREAARLQTFDDDFLFGKSSTDAYKMIGNAVPPRFAKCVAMAVADLLNA